MEAFGLYLTLVNAEKLNLITILEIMRLQRSGRLTDWMKMMRAVVSLGKSVEAEYKAQLVKKHQPESSKGAAALGVSKDMASGPSSSDVAAALTSDNHEIYSEMGLDA